MSQAQALFETIPDNVKRELGLAGFPLSKALQVEELAHGLSNQNYLLRDRLTNEAWVLRVNSSASSHICDRDAEVENWYLAAEKGLAPALYYVSLDRHYYLSEYIEQKSGLWGQLLTANPAHPSIDDDADWPDADKILLRLLTQLSRLPVPKNSLSVTRQWTIYKDGLQTLANSIPATTIGNKWRESHSLLLSLQDNIRLCLIELEACATGEQYSHRDLNPHNILLKEGLLYCIDFEYACSSHPLFDLAGVLASHSLSTTQRHNLINSYLYEHPKLTVHAKTSLPDAINIYWVFAASWSLLMAADEIGPQVNAISPPSSPHQAAEYLSCFEQFYGLIQKASD